MSQVDDFVQIRLAVTNVGVVDAANPHSELGDQINKRCF